MKPIKRAKKIQKLNLIPILDAIFIFIFFLLMSAQFIDIYQIGSDAPVVSTVTEDNKNKEEPLNLTMHVSKINIRLTTGLDNKTYKTIGLKDGEYDFEKLTKVLVTLKSRNIDESSVIIKPSSTVKYKQIVKVMDAVKRIQNKMGLISGVSKKTKKKVTTDKLFDQIIFETVM